MARHSSSYDINRHILESRLKSNGAKDLSHAMAEGSFEAQVAGATGLKVSEYRPFGADVFLNIATIGRTIPNWWSPSRDKVLSTFWKEINHLAFAVYNAQSKLVGIPFQIVARDPTNDGHVTMAAELTELFDTMSEFGKGWSVAYARFVEDLLTQDNGAFMEIISSRPGNPAGRLIGRPVAVRHLDAQRCQRTSHPVYPVLYRGDDGKLYKLHWTRVITMAQMPSARQDMNGVGLCAVSRAVDIAQNLLDITIYKQERLGSRPPNQILVGKGITGEQIMEALYQAEMELDDMGHARYSRTVAIGSENPDIELNRVEMTHMDPFDEETSITLGMFAIAGAFGLDASEIWPTASGSTNKADAALRRLRSRGKLPAQTTAELEAQMNFKLVPTYLRVRFDFKDDEEDQQRALIRDIRGRNRERDISTGTIDIRAARQGMVDDGDLDRKLFEMMEVEDGRLPDGTSVGRLFFMNDPIYERHLSFSDIKPLVIHDNDPEQALIAIDKKRQGLFEEWANTSSSTKSQKLMMANAALTWLSEQYEKIMLGPIPEVPLTGRRLQATQLRMTTLDERNNNNAGGPGTDPGQDQGGNQTAPKRDPGSRQEGA